MKLIVFHDCISLIFIYVNLPTFTLRYIHMSRTLKFCNILFTSLVSLMKLKLRNLWM